MKNSNDIAISTRNVLRIIGIHKSLSLGHFGQAAKKLALPGRYASLDDHE